MKQKRITKETIQKTLVDSTLLLESNKKICENLKSITKLCKDNVKHSSHLVEHFEREAEKDSDVFVLYTAVTKVSSQNLKDAADAELSLASYLETISKSEAIVASLTKLMQMSDEEFEATAIQAEILLAGTPQDTFDFDFLSVGKKKGVIN